MEGPPIQAKKTQIPHHVPQTSQQFSLGKTSLSQDTTSILHHQCSRRSIQGWPVFPILFSLYTIELSVRMSCNPPKSFEVASSNSGCLLGLCSLTQKNPGYYFKTPPHLEHSMARNVDLTLWATKLKFQDGITYLRIQFYKNLSYITPHQNNFQPNLRLFIRNPNPHLQNLWNIPKGLQPPDNDHTIHLHHQLHRML